jgi:membrane protein
MADSTWDMAGLSAKQLLLRVKQGIDEHEILDRSAELAYYFFLAIFPMLLFVMSVVGLISGPGSSLEKSIADSLARVAPPDAAQMVHRVITQTFHSSGGLKAAFGIIGALWSASAGASALMSSLNAVFATKETRPWWITKPLAVFITVADSVLITAALALLLVGPTIATHLAEGGLVGQGVKWIWLVLQWPLVLFLVTLAFAIVYYFAPNVEHPKWHWITPGSIAGLLIWLAVSFGLRVYLHFFNSYTATYGAVTAAIILLLWFYLTGAAVLLGGQINSVLEHAKAAQGEGDLKKPAHPPQAA